MSDYERETTPTEYNWNTSLANAAQQQTIDQMRGMSGFGLTGTSLSDIQLGDLAGDTVGRWIDSQGVLHDTRPQNDGWFDSFMDKTFGNIAPILQYGPYVAGAALTAGAGAAAGLGSLASNTIAGGAMGAAAGGVEGDDFSDVIRGGLLGAAGGAATTLAAPYVSSGLESVGDYLSTGGGGPTPGFEEAFFNANPSLLSGGETIVPGYENVFTGGMEYSIDPTLALNTPQLRPFESYVWGGAKPDPYAGMRPFSDNLINELGGTEGLLTPSDPLFSYEGQNIFGEGLGLTGPDGNYFAVDPDLLIYNDWITARQLGSNFGNDLTWINGGGGGGFGVEGIVEDIGKYIKPATTIASLLGGGSGLFGGGAQPEVPGSTSSWINPAAGDVLGRGQASGGFANAGGGGASGGSAGLASDLAKRSKGLITNPIADEIARFSGQKYYT